MATFLILGTPFRQKGYDLSFIYGGFGYFDNMNAFFSGNGYRVVDKLNFAPENKTFATAWGQCDGDLLAESIVQADAMHAKQQPFHQVLLTTSNHRPFLFPEGKINPELMDTRRGAVNYSDYAIGNFIQIAKTKPWFDNTIFIFIGDHPSSIAGKTDLPADAYGIVAILYGPQFFKPQKVETLCSQIDLAPTLLRKLNWNDTTPFFGTDALALAPEEGRAWISTYQLLGFRTNTQLAILKPNAQTEIRDIATDSNIPINSLESAENDLLLTKTIAFYQYAYDLFVDGGLLEPKHL